MGRDFFTIRVLNRIGTAQWLHSSEIKVQSNMFWHGSFWGLIFGPGIFLGFAGSPRDFLGLYLLLLGLSKGNARVEISASFFFFFFVQPQFAIL